MGIYNSRKEDELREINVYRKEKKKSPFLSLREKFSQAFGQASMWWGALPPFSIPLTLKLKLRSRWLSGRHSETSPTDFPDNASSC